MMETTSGKIAEIAHEVGFEDLSFLLGFSKEDGDSTSQVPVI
ncbi:hypothetical protein [Paenibacillus phytorum]|nr:hypothetical protein [Paenibacillus phytorum]